MPRKNERRTPQPKIDFSPRREYGGKEHNNYYYCADMQSEENEATGEGIRSHISPWKKNERIKRHGGCCKQERKKPTDHGHATEVVRTQCNTHSNFNT